MQKAHILLRNSRLGTRSFEELTARIFQLETLHISDIIRRVYSEDSPIAVRLKSFIEDGQLVPDALITEIIAREISAFPGDFQLIDYPRTVNQFGELLELFNQKGITLHTLWVLELNDIEPLIISQQKNAELKGFHDKFAPESEEILRSRFQLANTAHAEIKQAFKDKVPIKVIGYDHPLEGQIDEISRKIRSYPR